MKDTHAPEAFVLIGMPGSGKSYIYQNTLDHLRLFDPDEYSDIPNGSKVFWNEFGAAIERGESFVFTTPGVDSDRVQEIIKYIRDNGYIVNLVYVDAPIDTCVDRVKKRCEKTGKKVNMLSFDDETLESLKTLCMRSYMGNLHRADNFKIVYNS